MRPKSVSQEIEARILGVIRKECGEYFRVEEWLKDVAGGKPWERHYFVGVTEPAFDDPVVYEVVIDEVWGPSSDRLGAIYGSFGI